MDELLNDDIDYSQAKCATKSNAWEIFFPEGEQVTAKIGYAKALCAQCPVVVACFTNAMTKGNELHGIWGKTTQIERNRMRKDVNLVDLHIKSLNN